MAKSSLKNLCWQIFPTIVFFGVFLSISPERLHKNLSFLPDWLLNLVLIIHTDLLGVIFSVLTFFGKIAVVYLDSVPQINGTIVVSHPILQDVTITRDANGFATITAKNIHDLVFAQGYVHAQDRLWQMEVSRKIAKGQLSSFLGSKALEVDKFVRTLGFHRAAANDVTQVFNDESMKEEQKMLQSYLEGINEFVAHNSKQNTLGAEFKLLSHYPENFTLHDVFSFSRFMAWAMSKGWDGEVVRSALIDRVGKEHAHYIDSNLENSSLNDDEVGSANPVHLPACCQNAQEAERLVREAIEQATGPAVFVGEMGGSNAWVVGPSLTESGHSILCNDPHLQLQNPSTWYFSSLQTPEIQLRGFGIPLSPLILLGSNSHIAWGVTLARTDVEDLFEEHIRLREDGVVLYEFQGTMRESTSVTEVIEIAGAESPAVLQVVETHHGPLVSDIFGLARPVSFASTTIQTASSLSGFHSLCFAKNWTDFLNGVSQIHTPPLNVLYTDVEDNIGYALTGRIPLRAGNRDGSHIARGWTGNDEWHGWVPFAAHPVELNPERGYIVSANNRIAEADAVPFPLGRAWATPARAERIVEMLEEKINKTKTEDRKLPRVDLSQQGQTNSQGTIKGKGLLDRKDMQEMQTDVVTRAGLRFIQQLFRFPFLTPKPDSEFETGPTITGGNPSGLHPDVLLARSILLEWDGTVHANSSAATLYHAIRRHLFFAIFSPSLGTEGTMMLQGRGVRLLLKMSNDFHGFDLPLLSKILADELADPGSVWWIQRAGGIDKVVTNAIKESVSTCRRVLGIDHKKWDWGKSHFTQFTHALGKSKPLDLVFNIGGIPIGGDSETVALSATLPHTGNINTGWAVSFRAIYEVAEFANCSPEQKSCKGFDISYVMPPGISGHPASPWFRNQIEPWINGEWFFSSGHPAEWSLRDSNAEYVLKLQN